VDDRHFHPRKLFCEDSFRILGRPVRRVPRIGPHESRHHHKRAWRTWHRAASVAFDAGIISPQFYTTLVVAAVLTSQVAGAWLDYVLGKGWPLLTPMPSRESTIGTITESPLVFQNLGADR
jgi:hypothetical protein